MDDVVRIFFKKKMCHAQVKLRANIEKRIMPTAEAVLLSSLNFFQKGISLSEVT